MITRSHCHNELNTIDLTNAGLGQSGIAALADTLLYAAGELGRGSILRTLRLSGNNCRDAGADGIAIGARSHQFDTNIMICHAVVAIQSVFRDGGTPFRSGLYP